MAGTCATTVSQGLSPVIWPGLATWNVCFQQLHPAVLLIAPLPNTGKYLTTLFLGNSHGLSVSPLLFTRCYLVAALPVLWLRNLGSNNLTGSIPDSISTLTSLEGIMLNNNQLSGTIPSAIFNMMGLKYLWLDNNKIEGPLPSSLCLLPGLWRFIIFCPLYAPRASHSDVSGNSLYGRINRDFKSMVADGGALINLANNFFFGDAVLFAAGCKVCPTEVNEPNYLDLWNISKWMVGGKCNEALVNNSVMGAGSAVRVSLSGNCLTLSPNAGCASHAIQRSKAACKAICSITANGPSDGHGECVQPDPASPSKFTCLCDAGYSVVDSGNGSTCAIVYSNTTTVPLHCSTACYYSVAPSLKHYLFLHQCLFLAAFPILTALPLPASLPDTCILCLFLNHTSPCLFFDLPFRGSVLSVHGCHSGHCSGQLRWIHAAGCCGRMAAMAPRTKSAPQLVFFPFHLPHSCTTFLASFPASLLYQFSSTATLTLHCPHALSAHLHPDSLTPRVWCVVCTEKWEGLDVCEQFSLQQMLRATNNWSEDNVLGKGGFGVVYEGRSPQGQLWAIKRSTIMTNDFETEVRHASNPPHSALYSSFRKMLTCGFIAPLSLSVSTPASGADPRVRVYGQQGPRVPYPQDRKSSLTALEVAPRAGSSRGLGIPAQVADFGLLKRLTHGDADATRVAGNPGYVDPDYSRTNVTTVKSDVFSFGIVLLELLTGKSPRAVKLVEAYELEELRDGKMPAGSEEAIVEFADLALDCIKSPGTRRPTMKDVAYRLSALIDKHCPDKEDELESVVKKESEGNEGISSRSLGDSGRESGRSYGSQSGVGLFMRISSIGDVPKSWLQQLKPTKGR
ncbi:unnamed protein product [Closterium sp. Yama58-4]|nr:unnamed protein product [Closterium sp. Yama58-4]